MDYEKKYKQALDRAKKELNTCGSQDCDAARQIFRFFPKLAESEDERIRKEIISYLKRRVEISSSIPAAIGYWIAWLEKQGEKKSSWSKEDEQYLLVCKNALAKYQTTDKWDANIIYNWLKNKLQKL